MVSLQTIEAALVFMQRAQLQGAEVPAYATAFNELSRERARLQAPQEITDINPEDPTAEG